jgi:probable phosphoglycerate mutase
MNVFLIRHGETDINRAKQIQGRGIDAPLNEIGRRQALEVARALSDHNFDAVVSSSMMRARQTAEPLIKNQRPLLSYPELDEMSFGELEGRDFHEIKEEINKIHLQWSSGNVDHRIRGGESPTEVFHRASAKVLELLDELKPENIAFVLHGRLLRILLSEWLGHGLKNMHLIRHANGAINHLRWIEGRFEEVQLNRTDHLTEFIVY